MLARGLDAGSVTPGLCAFLRGAWFPPKATGGWGLVECGVPTGNSRSGHFRKPLGSFSLTLRAPVGSAGLHGSPRSSLKPSLLELPLPLGRP